MSLVEQACCTDRTRRFGDVLEAALASEVEVAARARDVDCDAFPRTLRDTSKIWSRARAATDGRSSCDFGVYGKTGKSTSLSRLRTSITRSLQPKRCKARRKRNVRVAFPKSQERSGVAGGGQRMLRDVLRIRKQDLQRQPHVSVPKEGRGCSPDTHVFYGGSGAD